MNNASQIGSLEEIIRLRRTVKPERMNGRLIADETVNELIAAADWAPTHAKTEPWRFIIFGPQKTKDFVHWHADLVKRISDPATFTQQKYDGIVRLGENVSHILVVWMKRIPNHKIPEIEEVAATAAAVQNLLLSATSKGIASFWSTGGATHRDEFRNDLGLGDEDRVMGILYLGYTDEPFRDGARMIPLSEKVEWRK